MGKKYTKKGAFCSFKLKPLPLFDCDRGQVGGKLPEIGEAAEFPAFKIYWILNFLPNLQGEMLLSRAK
jgi:hypothetical protein